MSPEEQPIDPENQDVPTPSTGPECAGEDPTPPTPEEEIASYRDRALRAQAELENFRKRMAREKQESIRYANASLIENFLPVLDSFDLGLSAAQSTQGAAAVVSGFEMVRKQMDDFLSTCGVQRIEAVGQVFDPNLHDAMGHEPSNDIPEEHVIRQMRPGYRLHDRLLRPASVVVSSGPGQAG